LISCFIAATAVRVASGQSFEVEGALIHSDFLYGYFWVMAIIFSAGVAEIWHQVFIKKAHPGRLFVITALVFGVLFMMAEPYRATFDERVHSKTAQYYASILLGADHWVEAEEGSGRLFHIWENRGEDASLGFEDSPTLATYYHVWTNLFTLEAEPGTTFEDYVETNSQVAAPYLYLPTTIATLLARLLHFGQVPTVYLGKLFYLLFYIALMYPIVRIVPTRFKYFFLLCALMPHAVFDASSFSYDTMPIMLCLMFIGYTLYLNDKDTIRLRDLVPLIALGAFLAPTKMVYTPVLLMPLMIPASHWGSRKRKLQLCGLTLLVGLAALLLMHVGSLASFFSYYSGNGTSVVSNTENFNVRTILENKTTFLRIFAVSFIDYFGLFAESTARGGISLPFPMLVKFGAFLLLILSVSQYKGESVITFSKYQKLLMGGIALITYLGLLMISVRWTPLANYSIWGFSARYLTPVLPLVVLLFSSAFKRVRLSGASLFFVLAVLMSYSTFYFFTNYILW
jgi:uncharacterized membrane protein